MTANISKQQLKATKTRIYNLSKVKKNKKWLKNILLDKSDSSESDLESEQQADECIRDMIRFHQLQKKTRKEFESNPQAKQYQNYSLSLLASQSQTSSLLSSNANLVSSPSKKTSKSKSKKSKSIVISATETRVKNEPNSSFASIITSQVDSTNVNVNLKANLNESSLKIEKLLDENKYDTTLPDDILQTESSSMPFPDPLSSSSSTFKINENVTSQLPDEIFDTEESSGSVLSQTLSQPTPTSSLPSFTLPKCSTAPPTPTASARSSPPLIPMKAIKKLSKKKQTVQDKEAVANMKRNRLWVSIARKEIPKAHKQKMAAKKEQLTNAKRMANWCQREKRKATLAHQKQFCRDQYSRARRLTKEMLLYWKRFEKVEKDYRKRAEKEAQEQLRIDIELMEAKRQQRKLNFLITQTELYAHFMSKKLSKLTEPEDENHQQQILKQLEDEAPVTFTSGVTDDYDVEIKKQEAVRNADSALKAHQQQTLSFDNEMNLANPPQDVDHDGFPQPKIFKGLLKSYQLKGMNWLYNLYDKGINGILADEMGLGKTVQTIAFLATLAERLNVWGPFLIIAPSSTLHNWQQEFTKFVPKIKVLPYWGNPNDRKVLRKFWNQKYLHREEASFHVLVTSYQLVVQDVKYFQRIKWMYMVLDEAQAIKSTSSVRWKILLAFQCRNRLLLTGTPIQNSMAELWALLHFIMPTMFDSHEEFNEWFSKDIESHAENKTAIDEKHLSRLHMILKPFMLRRIKKDVENELSDKIEIKMFCGLTSRQQLLYKGIKNKISIEELLSSSSSSSSESTSSTLMNLVMQFRKVCNHPDLFERRDVRSPFHMQLNTLIIPRLIFESGLCHDQFQFNCSIYKLFNCTLNIFNCDYVYRSIFSEDSTQSNHCFSFLKLINLSPSQLIEIIFGDFIIKWQFILDYLKTLTKLYHQNLWHEENGYKQQLLIPIKTTIFTNNKINSVDSNDLWSNLLFTWNINSQVYTFSDHTIHYMQETPGHREMRIRKLTSQQDESDVSKVNLELNDSSIQFQARNHRVFQCEQTVLPSFFHVSINGTNGLRVTSKLIDVYCNDQKALRWYHFEKLGGSQSINNLVLHGDIDNINAYPHQIINYYNRLFRPPNLRGIIGLRQPNGWSSIVIPDKETLVTDSGKLTALDQLLSRLKEEGHRVLIYSQMTKMIDLLEEYMLHRKHTYMRLDGSSRILDRRDMVADFQNRSDIFVFLLSTRAGGLGINLTAADTVIFYDSDWNPTVDQQAMDRAHRLGQTKQVTVYRLVCKGTIEERILQRAKEKSEIQRMVISGGTFKPDTLKPTEVVSLLLDDEELERKFRQRQEERKDMPDENGGIKGVKRKVKKDPDQPKVSQIFTVKKLITYLFVSSRENMSRKTKLRQNQMLIIN